MGGCLFGCVLSISIPSGAIKSCLFDLFNARLQFISIPSGAIKSSQLKDLVGGDSTFQFLLVRLRAASTSVTVPKVILFQFLLVRLRDLIFLSFMVNTS